jgi:hypothetical protein
MVFPFPLFRFSGDAFLVAVEQQERTGFYSRDRKKRPIVVAATRLFDLDDLRAEIGEHLRAECAGQQSAKI